MADILRGNYLDLYNRSPNLLGTHTGSGDLFAGRAVQSDGIYANVTTGNLVIQRRDEYLASFGIDNVAPLHN